jgi:VanZ family protein
MSARRAWVAAAVWLVFQLVLTSLPGSAMPSVPGYLDWVAHFGMYGGLALLVARAAERSGWKPQGRHLIWIALAVLAALDEQHQRLIPGRDAELGDWIMDSTGAAAGLALATLGMRTRLATWLR